MNILKLRPSLWLNLNSISTMNLNSDYITCGGESIKVTEEEMAEIIEVIKELQVLIESEGVYGKQEDSKSNKESNK